MQDLKVTLVQADLVWEDKTSNYKKISGLLKNLKGETDLIILPEMYNTGFSMQPEQLGEEMGGEGTLFLINRARELNCVVTGSLIIREDGKFFNRLIWAEPDGSIQYYDKRHLFSMAGEHKHYAPGSKKLITTLKDWKICPMVCYDLRFPVWSRNTENFDLLIFNANWPEKRIMHWDKLIPARAIENQVYVVGVNRVGNDGNGIYHNGSSQVADPMGEQLIRIADEEKVTTVTLSYDMIEKTRRHMPFLRDRDNFLLK